MLEVISNCRVLWKVSTFITLYEYDGQRKRTKYTVPQVDKGTSLHCYYVKMCRTGEYACDTCSTHFYTIAVKGCSFVYLRNCIFCPLSLSVMFIVLFVLFISHIKDTLSHLQAKKMKRLNSNGV